MHYGLHQPENARFLYLDMNAFFASVEQQRNPELRDLPLAVVSHIGPAGTVLASSYEAKAFGITTGMRLKEAWAIKPGLRCVATEAAPYRAVHKQFMAILHDICGPEVQAYSIDEAVIPLPPNWYGSALAHQLALRIKERFKAELGPYIRCSIGIAPNSFLGKLATDLQKPDGLVEITLENITTVLSQLKLTDLPGIALRSAGHLQAAGIETPLQFYEAPLALLQQQFGAWGQYWWWRLHGHEVTSTSAPHHKSISHQHALSHWAHTRQELEGPFYRMTDRLIHRLRTNHLQCRRVGVFASLHHMRSQAFEIRLDSATGTYAELAQHLRAAFEQLPLVPPAPVRKLGIYFMELIPESTGMQLDIFTEKPRKESVSQALELIRGRHGFEAIQRGNLIALNPAIAKEQLGFGRIKDIS